MSLQTTTATGDQTIALDAGTTVLRCLTGQSGTDALE